MNEMALLIAATIASGTPLALAGLGLLLGEKAGVLNLGAEGMMLVAAIAGFATASLTGSQGLAFAAGAGAGALMAVAFGVLVIWLNTNQYATGLALSIFGGGFSAFVGVAFVGKTLGEPVQYAVPLLADIPWLGTALFRQHPMAYAAIVLTAAIAWFLCLAIYHAFAYVSIDLADPYYQAAIREGCVEDSPRYILSNLGFATIAILLTLQRIRRRSST